MADHVQQLAPANDYDLGACLWGYGTTLDELVDWTLGIDANLETMRRGWVAMERSYEAYCLEAELAHHEFSPDLDDPFNTGQ